MKWKKMAMVETGKSVSEIMKWKKMAMVETGKSVSDLPVQTTLRNVGAKFVVYTHVAG